MVVAKLPVAVEDPFVSKRLKLAPERVLTDDEPFFLDGPVAARAAVVDRDPANGRLAEPVRWSARRRTYQVPDEQSAPEAIAVSVFGIVLETLALFERQDVLGHKVKWAFDSPQLLLVPRAGVWENAFYDRDSHSLQFFFFDRGPKRVHTALSRDIVAHETGHAILDALAMPLYDALSPQSLALHEAIGDFTAIIMALSSPQIRAWLVRKNGGTLLGSTPVSQLASEFGLALANRPLRDANNDTKLKDAGDEPHDLCEVLTGAGWAAMAQFHDQALKQAPAESAGQDEDPRAAALGISARRIARILFRALDYLPPAEASFADYARALLRSDAVVYPTDETGYRRKLRQEFLARGVVRTQRELDHTPAKEYVRADLDDVLESDWTAYDFANRERALLAIPKGVPFRLFPRRNVERLYYLSGGRKEPRREVVFQVTWEALEENTGIASLPSERAVFHGTTLVLGEERDKQGRQRVLSCLSTDGAERHVAARTRMVRDLAERGQLRIGDRWEDVRRRPLAPAIFARVAGDRLRLRGTARLLHLAGRPDG